MHIYMNLYVRIYSLPCQLREPRKNITTVAMSLSTIQILAFKTILQ